MKIIKANDYEELSKKAAEIICRQVKEKENSVLGLATGASPVGVYEKMIEAYKNDNLDFSKIHTANLDEYKGMVEESPDSYHYFMQKHLFGHINIKPENIMFPDGMAEDAEKECREYDEKIAAAGGIDLQLLGIGVNGHIGFNEPADCFVKGTHVVKLTESTKKANEKYLKHTEILPEEAFTMGIGNIFSADKILLIASGASKAEAIKKTIYGPITPQVPASILQLHKDVTIIADKEALSECDITEEETYL
jgi:glucosamine-6-phosphate deaminase